MFLRWTRSCARFLNWPMSRVYFPIAERFPQPAAFDEAMRFDLPFVFLLLSPSAYCLEIRDNEMPLKRAHDLPPSDCTTWRVHFAQQFEAAGVLPRRPAFPAGSHRERFINAIRFTPFPAYYIRLAAARFYRDKSRAHPTIGKDAGICGNSCSQVREEIDVIRDLVGMMWLHRGGIYKGNLYGGIEQNRSPSRRFLAADLEALRGTFSLAPVARGSRSATICCSTRPGSRPPAISRIVIADITTVAPPTACERSRP